MILVVLSHARNISHDGDIQTLEKLWVSNTRSLQNLRRSEGTSGDNDQLLSLHDLGNRLSSRLREVGYGLVAGVGNILNPDSFWRR